MRSILFLFSITIFLPFSSQAIPDAHHRVALESMMDSIPPVFLIGQYSEECEKLNLTHLSLLQVCQDEVLLAYDKWMYMLAELNDMSNDFGIDLSSCKFWFSVYYTKEGTIKHFSYYLKPGSKKIDATVFDPFLLTFIANYKMPVSANKPFSNYGSAVFPIAYRKQVARKN